MTASPMEKRVFVVGVPRSGTTLVQSLLASHSALTSFTESHFLSRNYALMPLSGTPVLVRAPTPRVRGFLTESGVDDRTAARLAASLPRGGPLLPLRGRRALNAFIGILDHLALERGASGWVEKTPAHLRYLPYIERATGAATTPLFVHVVRRGLDVVASLHRASQRWERPYDLETCAARWNADVSFSLGRVGLARDRFVFYEDLTDDPRAALTPILEALDLPWESAILEIYGQAAHDLIGPDEDWKANVGRPIRASTGGGGALPDEQRELVSSRLDRGLYDRLRNRIADRAAGGAGLGGP